jgi:outer membrane protein assembly factor BamB
VRQAFAISVVLVALVAATSTGAAVLTLPGTYTTKISAKQPSGINGEWAIEIMKNGDYLLLKRISKTQGRVQVRGKALLNPKHVVTFTKEKGPLACTSTGKYRWTRNGKRLTFERLHDTCVGRQVVLGGVFKRVA